LVVDGVLLVVGGAVVAVVALGADDAGVVAVRVGGFVPPPDRLVARTIASTASRPPAGSSHQNPRRREV
jgi:hypothetical protein